MKNYARLGREQEQAIVRWAKQNGFPHADRTVRTGAGKDYAHRADEGDISLCPGLIVQSKRLEPANRAERAVPQWMQETEAQRRAAGADIALLIVRREGTTDIGEWWAWLPSYELKHLYADRCERHYFVNYQFPVRLLVRDAVTLLRAAGYGDPIGVAA